MPKGSLPIEIVIVLVLGVLVIVAVLTFFMGSFKPAAGGTSLQVATQEVCLRLKSANACTGLQGYDYPIGYTKAANLTVKDFDANRDGMVNQNTDTLAALCKNYYYCTLTLPPIDSDAWLVRTCCFENVCGCPKL